MGTATEFQYRVPWRATSCYPGVHHSVQKGNGYDIHGLLPLHVAGDPRRFDVRATLRDPFGQLQIRVYKQRSKVPVFALADVSASMGFIGQTCKYELLTQFVSALANSAQRVGDPFGFTACDTEVREELSLPLMQARGSGDLIFKRLREWTPCAGNAEGLLAGAEQAPHNRALIFLISDFYLPLDLLREILGRLSRHDVIPVVLSDTAERRIPGVGIAHLHDPETNGKRTIVLRRSLGRRLKNKVIEHRQQLLRCFAEFEVRPLTLIDKFEPEAVNRYFHE